MAELQSNVLTLDDFDAEVRKRVDSMKKKTVALEEEFRQLFAIELARIVKSLQNMTLFEFLELCISKNINMDGILPGIDEISLKTEIQKHRDLHRSKENIRRQESNIKVPSSNSNLFITPAYGNRSRGICPTETPQFDPRLPFTPAVGGLSGRLPKRGESLMSLNGSPLQNVRPSLAVYFPDPEQDVSETVISVPLNDGQELYLPVGSDMSETLSNLDKTAMEETVRRMKALRDQMNAMLAQVGEM